jgi:hypothetical protein
MLWLHPKEWRKLHGEDVSELIDTMLEHQTRRSQIALDLLGSAARVRIRSVVDNRFAPATVATLVVAGFVSMAAIAHPGNSGNSFTVTGTFNMQLVSERQAHHLDHANQVHWRTITTKTQVCRIGTEHDRDLSPSGSIQTSGASICVPKN